MKTLAAGDPGSPGTGRGRLHVDVDDALDAIDAGHAVVLVVEATSPADVPAMIRSAAVVTATGGRESHAAVITRSEGIPSVLGVADLQIAADHILLGMHRIDVGEEVVVDGSNGTIARPAPPALPSAPMGDSSSHADEPDDALGLDEAYAVETPDDNRRLYAKWADTYESGFIETKGYQYHERVADVFVAGPRPDGPTLDVGCGTGIVGEALRDRGVGRVDGVDISAEMLDQARTKGVYTDLLEADLTVGMDVADDTYAGITSAGTFTHGHLPPEPLAELIRVSMPGARCAIGINAAHWSDHGFEAFLDTAVADGRIEPYEITVVKVYEGSDPANPDDMSNVVSFTVR